MLLVQTCCHDARLLVLAMALKKCLFFSHKCNMKQTLISGVAYLQQKNISLSRFSSSGLFEWKKEKKVFPRLEEPGSPDVEAAAMDGKAFGFLCVSVVWELWH